MNFQPKIFEVSAITTELKRKFKTSIIMLVTIRRYSELAKVSLDSIYKRIEKGLLKVEPEDLETGIGMSLIDTKKYPPETKIRQGRPLKIVKK